MAANADKFLASFNRIEKWLRDEADTTNGVGFSELVRRLSRRSDLLVRHYHDDLLELAQLRNAIVHNKISPDFVIAEPNQWVLNKLTVIEKELLAPERVMTYFKKEVAYFDAQTPLSEVLPTMADKGFSQFPIYEGEKLLGLITAHGLGMFLASQDPQQPLVLKDKKVKDVLRTDRHKNNYRFIATETYVFQAAELFLAEPSLEALLITADGQEAKELLGIIRPKEISQQFYKEWWQEE